MNSAVKFPAAHFRRRPSLLSFWAWVALLVSSLASMGVARPNQDFPIAAEEDNYIFRSDGTYSFSYDTGSGEHQSFRMEARDATGRVSGRYGYIDPDGVLRITQYQADSTGYRANMLIFRKVTSPPPEPLLVGPLPRRVPEPDPELAPQNAPQGDASGPIGPVPFFTPDKPVLIIGPLPRPLQPPRDDNEVIPDLEVGIDFDASQGISLSSPLQDILQDSAIRTVPLDPPPDSQDGILETFLQGNLNNIFQGPVPSLFINPNSRGTQDISVNSFQGTERNVSFPSSDVNRLDLEKISQGLLQGPEVVLNNSKIRTIGPIPFPIRRNVTSNSTEERIARTPTVNILPNRGFNSPPLNTAFDVFVKVATESPSLSGTQERQNGTQKPPAANNKTSVPPVMLKKNNSSVLPSMVSRTVTPPFTMEGNREKTMDTDRSPSVPVPINFLNVPTVPSIPAVSTVPLIPKAPPVPPPLTYLPADNTNVPRQPLFFGQLPND